MYYCHEHNRPVRQDEGPRPWGLRLSLPPDDPMRPLLGDDWFKLYWFATEAERERKIRELTEPFPYYRRGDQPRVVIETLEAGGNGGEE